MATEIVNAIKRSISWINRLILKSAETDVNTLITQRNTLQQRLTDMQANAGTGWGQASAKEISAVADQLDRVTTAAGEAQRRLNDLRGPVELDPSTRPETQPEPVPEPTYTPTSRRGIGTVGSSSAAREAERLAREIERANEQYNELLRKIMEGTTPFREQLQDQQKLNDLLGNLALLRLLPSNRLNGSVKSLISALMVSEKLKSCRV